MINRIGIIGGSGLYSITDGMDLEEKTVTTPYGDSVDLSLFRVDDKDVVFIPRHKSGHKIPPHMINYRSNIFALKELGVNQIIATNAVGSLRENISPDSLVLPDDFIDFTCRRDKTFFDNEVVHTDFTQPYCNRLRDIISKNGKLIKGGVHVCTEGPRFETGAEIKMFQILGGDIVGMTGLPEAVLAKEKMMCYSSLCVVTNYSTPLSEDRLTMEEVLEMMEVKKEEIIKIILNSIEDMPIDYDCDCLNRTM
ncbi:MAG: S-methyl-5'-thioadenosine phosphorylase [Methanobrevibacter sp.]|jgi:5'-methylthioadenosine phosphorylase|nr:S-methyl-5'-thioadenosine phosphorylase [Candidatus Methanovirga aequatorialis]